MQICPAHSYLGRPKPVKFKDLEKVKRVLVALSSFGRILGECSTSHSTHTVEICLCTQISFLCQDQSTVAQRVKVTLAECSLTGCVSICFQIGSHTIPGQQHSQPTPTSADALIYIPLCMYKHTFRERNRDGNERNCDKRSIKVVSFLPTEPAGSNAMTVNKKKSFLCTLL